MPLLVLARRNKTRTFLILPDGTRIIVTVVEAKFGRVRLAFECRPEVKILREELELAKP